MRPACYPTPQSQKGGFSLGNFCCKSFPYLSLPLLLQDLSRAIFCHQELDSRAQVTEPCNTVSCSLQHILCRVRFKCTQVPKLQGLCCGMILKTALFKNPF